LFFFSGARFQIRYEPDNLTREEKESLAVDSSFFKGLPVEILEKIFENLDPLDLVRNVAAVSERFFYVINNGISVNHLEILKENDYAHTKSLCQAILPTALMSLNVGSIDASCTAEHAIQLLNHIQSTCKSVSICGNWRSTDGLINNFFDVLLQKTDIEKLEFKIFGQTFQDFWLPLSTGDQLGNVQHLKIKCPNDSFSKRNEVTVKGAKPLKGGRRFVLFKLAVLRVARLLRFSI